MRSMSVLLALALSGCAALSGLSSLTVDGGAVGDATSDVANEGAPSDFDASVTGDGACAGGAIKVGCFGLQCSATCCVSTSTYQASCANSCAPNTAKFECTSPADCVGSDAGSACCFKGFSSTSNTCPLIVQVAQGTVGPFGTSCTPPDGCLSTSTAQIGRMCAGDTDCMTGQKCDLAAFGDAGGPKFSVCR